MRGGKARGYATDVHMRRWALRSALVLGMDEGKARRPAVRSDDG